MSKSNIALDLTDAATEGVWLDWKNEEPIYTNWRPNAFPNDDVKDIVTMNKVGEWNLIESFKNVAVVCQYVCNSGNENCILFWVI